MKLKTLIIDDEPLAHDILLEYAKDCEFLEVKAQCYSATEALVFLQKEEVDLIFLDIQMPKLKGLDFLRLLKDRPQVIITSAYQEYALESYELEVYDYLLKPFRFDRFLKAVQKVMAFYELKNKRAVPSKEKSIESTLFIKSDKKIIQISPEEIVFIESYGNYIKIWQGDNYHLSMVTLSNMEEQLKNKSFIRVHKSYLINREKIDFVEGNEVKMKNGVCLPVGKSYRTGFKTLLLGD